MSDHLDRARERVEVVDGEIRRTLQLIDSVIGPTGGWLISPADFRERLAERLSLRIAFRAGVTGDRGPLLNVQPHRGKPGYFWGTCPWCARAGVVGREQAEGRVSIECPCGYHETHDHRPRPKGA